MGTIMKETDCCQVITTVPDKNNARRMATFILDQRLGACVQFFAIESMYRWQGCVEHSPEILLQAKTTTANAGRLQSCIRKHHPYDTPEIIVLPIIDGLPEYLAWIRDETR